MAHQVSLAQQLCDQAYYLVYGYKLTATPANFKWALKQSSQDILKYTFTEGEKTYTILEYAVKLEDCAAISALKHFNADFEYSPALRFGNILHFYLDCLKENQSPHIELLNLIIDSIADINQPESGYIRTPLEYALKKMANFTTIHWVVIETLFKRGASIENPYYNTTPVNSLQDAVADSSIEEEKRALDHLVYYIKLEKKYFPTSQSCLELDDFISLSSNFMGIFAQAAISMSVSSFIASSIDSFATSIESDDFSKKLEASPEEEVAKFKGMILSFQYHTARQEDLELCKLVKLLCEYHNYFQALVKQGEFKQCFDLWIIDSLIAAIKSNRSDFARSTLKFFENCGLSSQSSSD